MMAMRRKEIYARYLRSIRQGDVEGFSHMYEQIKHEVTYSLMNWLNIYFMNDDKTCSHGCGGSNKSNKFNQDHQENQGENDEEDSGCSSRRNSSKKSSASKTPGMRINEQSPSKPRDEQIMIKTLFRAGQVWPDWCGMMEVNAAQQDGRNFRNLEVYHDVINDRLCVLNQGTIEYPRITHLIRENAQINEEFNNGQMNQQMHSLSINTQYVPDMQCPPPIPPPPPPPAPPQYQNVPPPPTPFEMTNQMYASSECINQAFQPTMQTHNIPPQFFQPQYQFLQPPPMVIPPHISPNMALNGHLHPEMLQSGGLAAMGKWYSVPNMNMQ